MGKVYHAYRFTEAPCAQVRECLLALPQRKWVFTNCNEKHAKLALETLQLEVMLYPTQPPTHALKVVKGLGYSFHNCSKAVACSQNMTVCVAVPKMLSYSIHQRPVVSACIGCDSQTDHPGRLSF